MDRSKALTAPPLAGVPSRSQWATICEAAKVLVQSGILPKGIDTPQKAAAIILKGAELGIPPMHAFQHLAVINGKVGCSAELHLALLSRGGVTWQWVKDGSDGMAEVHFFRPGFPQPFVGSFSREEAKLAGLQRNPVWQSYEKAMLRARAVTVGARLFGADLLAGMSYTPEELGARVDADGEVVEVADADADVTGASTGDAEDIDFTETEGDDAVRRDLMRSITEVERALQLTPEHITRCRTKHAGTETLERADTAGVRRYLLRLLEYQRERLAEHK